MRAQAFTARREHATFRNSGRLRDVWFEGGPDPIHTKDGIGLSGYAAVAYFTESKAVKGSPQFEHEWRGVRWRFASAAHRETFAGPPEKYAPQYGGYCAYAVARNCTAPTDPEAWKVVEGKLYLNYVKTVRGLWEKELPEAIRRGDRNWPGALKKTAPGTGPARALC